MKVESNVDLLVPAFREKLAATMKSLVGQGYKPRVHETLRSLERAKMLVATGKSKARGGLSMHCYGVAADVICMDHGWECRKNHCRFFETLGACAEDNGLTWGGNWDRDERAGEDGENDLPHVQAVPAKPSRFQDKIRAMNANHVDTFLRSYYSGGPV
jgi:hypothetical protein